MKGKKKKKSWFCIQQQGLNYKDLYKKKKTKQTRKSNKEINKENNIMLGVYLF